jgi:hypothetical protein
LTASSATGQNEKGYQYEGVRSKEEGRKMKKVAKGVHLSPAPFW